MKPTNKCTKVEFTPADRLSLVSEYYFSRKLKEVARRNAEGEDIISLAIGSPDMPPSPERKRPASSTCGITAISLI